MLTILLASGLGLAAAAWADERLPPVDDPLTKAACGACHLPFPPQMLPRRSWDAILDGLDRHFGEDASLPEPKIAAIRAYLRARAADAGSLAGAKFLRDLPASATPLRITETPRWIREHRKIPAETWSLAAVGGRVDCTACHTQAAAGDYGERSLRTPR